MTEPDELYTLRAQYWLGHYQLCLEEAKTIARRPMSPALKQEREEFVQRANLGLGQPVSEGDTPALQILALHARYDMAAGNEEAQAAIISEIQSLLASSDSNPSAQLFAAQVFLKHGLTKDALQCVHLGTVLEHNALALQIYLKLDRLDLAQQALGILKAADEESVLTSLASAHIALAGGSSTAGDALHYLNALSEQYGPSPLLLILSACANILVGEYSEAETKLLEGKKEFGNNADLLINLIVASQYLDKSSDEYVQELRESFPHCHFLQALDRVDGAYSREAVKYKVAA